MEGKTPQEIVELHAAGALEAAVGADDFAYALRNTQPSVTSEETAAFVAWNREFGVASTGAVAGPKLAATPPPRGSSGAPSRPTPKVAPRSAPL